MKKDRTVVIEETFCDVCGEKCGNHTVLSDAEGNEQHACLDYNEEHGKQCAAVLRERVVAAAIERRDKERLAENKP